MSRASESYVRTPFFVLNEKHFVGDQTAVCTHKTAGTRKEEEEWLAFHSSPHEKAVASFN